MKFVFSWSPWILSCPVTVFWQIFWASKLGTKSCSLCRQPSDVFTPTRQSHSEQVPAIDKSWLSLSALRFKSQSNIVRTYVVPYCRDNCKCSEHFRTLRKLVLYWTTSIENPPSVSKFFQTVSSPSTNDSFHMHFKITWLWQIRTVFVWLSTAIVL